MARRILNQTLDIKMDSPPDEPRIVYLDGIDELTVQSGSALAVAWVASTIAVEISNNPVRGIWNDFPSGAVTITSSTFNETFNVTGIRAIRFRASSPASSAFRALLQLHGEGGE